MIKQLQSTRVCIVCGQRKPLVSFVELVGTGRNKSPVYGDICSTCRRAGLNQDDASGSNTRLQIDNKTKVQAELDKKALTSESIKRAQEEKAKKERTEAKETREEKKREEIEKKYREEYLKKKNESKPNAAKETTLKEKQTTQAKGFYQDKSQNNKTHINKEFNKQVIGQQLGKKTQGITADYIHKYMAATGRSADSLFGNLLGGLMRQKLQGNQSPAQKQPTKEESKKVNPQTTFANTEKKAVGNKTEAKESKENLATEFLRKNFMKR